MRKDESPPTATAEPRGFEEELGRRLREAGPPEIAALVEEHLDQLTPGSALQALRNPHIAAQSVALLHRAKHLVSSYQFRRELAFHAKAPEAIALRLISGLYWRDLARAGIDPRIRPLVRRQAEKTLTARLPSLALGERIALARLAGPAVLQELRKDGDPRVIRALLENSRMTEGQLIALVSSSSTPAAVLALIAKDRRWGARYAVRVALARNRRTPVEAAVHLLAGLRKNDLAVVANHRNLAPAVKRRARLLLGRPV